VQVTIDNGTTQAHFDVPIPGADLNIARSQVDIPLSPDLESGTYQVMVDVPGYAPTSVGAFTLIGTAVGEAMTATGIPHRTDIRFGDTIELVGYDLPRMAVAPGDSVPLTLYWRAETPLTERYKVFTHLLGDTFNAETGNFLWGQKDNEPGNGQSLTTLWAPASIIADTYRIPVDAHTPPGTYTIEIGMYGLVDGVRLPITAPSLTVSDNAVLLATVVVQ
jgi:hypothetical protein